MPRLNQRALSRNQTLKLRSKQGAVVENDRADVPRHDQPIPATSGAGAIENTKTAPTGDVGPRVVPESPTLGRQPISQTGDVTVAGERPVAEQDITDATRLQAATGNPSAGSISRLPSNPDAPLITSVSWNSVTRVLTIVGVGFQHLSGLDPTIAKVKFPGDSQFTEIDSKSVNVSLDDPSPGVDTITVRNFVARTGKITSHFFLVRAASLASNHFGVKL